MKNLSVSNKILDKYFGYLKNLDDDSKKRLIIKLIQSIGRSPEKQFDIQTLYGAWEDGRTTEEIINEIKSSRIDKENPLHL